MEELSFTYELSEAAREKKEALVASLKKDARVLSFLKEMAWMKAGCFHTAVRFSSGCRRWMSVHTVRDCVSVAFSLRGIISIWRMTAC